MKKLPLLVLAAAASAFTFAATPPEPLAAARALYHERGKSADAQTAFEQIAAADPTSGEAHYFLARLALRRDAADQALAHAEKSIALSPNNADYLHTLGDAYGLAAQKASVFNQFSLAKKCLDAYSRAIALAPDNVEFHQSRFEFYRTAPTIAGGGPEKAMAEAAAIKKLDAMRGRMAFASLYIAEKKYAQALAEFDEVLKITPDDYNALYQVGKFSATTGQFLDRGLVSLRRCLDLTPPTASGTPSLAAANWRLGQILEGKNDPAGARAAYETALKLDPKFTQAADALKKLK